MRHFGMGSSSLFCCVWGKQRWIAAQLLYLLFLSVLFTVFLWVLSWVFLWPNLSGREIGEGPSNSRSHRCAWGLRECDPEPSND